MDGLCSSDLSFTSPLVSRASSPGADSYWVYIPSLPRCKGQFFRVLCTDEAHAAANPCREWDSAEDAHGARAVETVWTSCGCRVHIPAA